MTQICLLDPDETALCSACAEWGTECGGTNRIVKEVQLERLKCLYPGRIALFKIGQTRYRAYREDAEIVAAITGATLVRHNGKPITAEFPYEQLKECVTKIIGAGHKVGLELPEWRPSS